MTPANTLDEAESRAAAAMIALREATKTRDRWALKLARAFIAGEPTAQVATMFTRAERAVDDRMTEREDADYDVARLQRAAWSQK